MNPMMNMNINLMKNMPFLNNDNEISITVQSNIKLKKKDKASILNDYSKFTYNYMPILFDKTFEENGIQNGSIINITNKIYNLVFKYNNNSTTISLGSNFIRNNINFNFDDGTPLNKLFQNDGVNLSILVYDTKRIIGG